MKPLPAQNPASSRPSDTAMPALPPALNPQPASFSTANRRASVGTGQRVYPWLLCTSTMVAAAFCLLYITKPVVMASQQSSTGFSESPVFAATPPPVAHGASLMPGKDRLPGEKPSATAPAATAPASRNLQAAFEQTNLRIQHILTAEAPGGHLARIDLDVPVLYQSRNLRWTPEEVAQARELLTRLADYQEKTQTLRAEGAELLDAWNQLVERSIPASQLRADSPTLPTNQQDAADTPRPAGLDTTELIKIQPAGK
ncbi:MAG: hypothetical protein EOP88_10805 [Verrucomicrobiaceae bacterium]|nr:MAG: hypothetical protein EOP88_10805 [Verrucomicrobiaceae bacterium]